MALSFFIENLRVDIDVAVVPNRCAVVNVNRIEERYVSQRSKNFMFQ